MKRRLWIVVTLVVLTGLYFTSGLDRWLTLDGARELLEPLVALREDRPLQLALIYFAGYVAVTALSLPGALVMTLVGGALFGLVEGVVLISFASSIGASLAFLVARFLLHDLVQARMGERLAAINRGIERDGSFYLLSLRLVPVFPFFAVNLLMALTPIRLRQFYWVSQLGMLPATILYVNAGTRLASIESAADIVSPVVWGSLLLLGLLPIASRLLLGLVKRRRLYAGWQRPKRFDRNLIVIGAGAGGLVAAYVGAAAKARVTLVEAEQMGGDCLNTGCVPSKALIRSARINRLLANLDRYGLKASRQRVDYRAIRERLHRVIEKIAPNDSVERYSSLGVEVLNGRARPTSPWCVEIDGRELTAPNIIVATGAEPVVPAIKGIEQVTACTSSTIWGMESLPRRLVVLGAGAIGCELAQAFAQLGSRVTLLARGELLSGEDRQIASIVADGMEQDGVELLYGCRALSCQSEGRGKESITVLHEGKEITIGFDVLLCAVGRRPRSSGLGLEALGIAMRADGTIDVDRFQRTTLPNILAVGDVSGPWQLTHAAGSQGGCSALNALFGQLWRFSCRPAAMPRLLFTTPELARVGINESEAIAAGIAYEVVHFDLSGFDRAIADGETDGLVKLLCRPGSGQLLGATIVSDHAGEMIAGFNLAIQQRIALGKLLTTIYPYPSWSEVVRAAAGEWRRAHPLSPLAEQLLGAFHRWRRG